MQFDLAVVITLVVVVVLCSIILSAIYKFDANGKTYEDAVQEQRMKRNALLENYKTKPKEKKNKKTAKKTKEKQVATNNENKENLTESEGANNGTTVENGSNKPHVDFKPEPEPIKQTTKKQPKTFIKKEKIRPILLNKTSSIENNVFSSDVLDSCDVPILNHFEQIHPKDEFELLMDVLLPPTNQPKEKPVKDKKPQEVSEQPLSKSNKKSSKQQPTPEIQQQKPAEPSVVQETIEKSTVPITVPVQNPVLVPNSGKEKKKKKSEFNMIQQLTERDGLVNLVRNAELSRSEVQILIDILLNKQQDGPVELDDWSEGKSDPVQKLKKQLAEKEKALAEEQAALIGVQTKLREIRSEQISERVQLQQKVRGLEEVLQSKQMEIQAHQNHIQTVTQKFQQQLKDEQFRVHNLSEEHSRLHLRLNQVQESENLVLKLQSENEDLSKQVNILKLELHRSNEEKMQQHAFRLQFNKVTEDLQSLQELNRKAEETKVELDLKCEKMSKERNDLIMERNKFQNIQQQQLDDIKRLQKELYQLQSEYKQLTIVNSDQIQVIAQLKNKLNKIESEMQTQESDSSELLTTNNELQETIQRYQDELESYSKKCKELEAQIEEHKVKNNELRVKNWKVMEALQEAESRLKPSRSSSKQIILNKAEDIHDEKLKEHQQLLLRIFPELVELEQVVSAPDFQEKCFNVISPYLQKMKDDVKEANTHSPSPPPSNLDSAEKIADLEAQIRHYQHVIDDTEKTLNDVQTRVQQEEIKWREQLSKKEKELEDLKQKLVSDKHVESTRTTNFDPQDSQGVQFAYTCIEKSLPLIIDELQNKVIDLEEKLVKISSEKDRLQLDFDNLRKQQKSSTKSGNFLDVEILNQQIEQLKEQLRIEQLKNSDSPKSKNSNSPNGHKLIETSDEL